MAKFEELQDKISETLDSVRSTQKNALYVVLGVQKAAIDFGSEKISGLRDRTQIDVDGFIKRGEEVEGKLTDKFDEFRNSDNAVAKVMAKVESQVKDLNESTEERFKKIGDQVSDVQDKVKEQFENIKARFSKDSKPAKSAAKKVTRKPAAKKPAVKKSVAKKSAAKKAA